jgi:hypothetical protein
MVLEWLKISKSLFTFTKKQKNDSQNWFMGVATWQNLHNTTKPVILTALSVFAVKRFISVMKTCRTAPTRSACISYCPNFVDSFNPNAAEDTKSEHFEPASVRKLYVKQFSCHQIVHKPLFKNK